MLGTSFSPATQNADPAQIKKRRLPVQQALQTLSLRLPKFAGQGSVAPAELMSGRGLSGASDSGLSGAAAMIRALLGQQGQQPPSGSGWPGGMLPSGLPTPAPQQMRSGGGGPMASAMSRGSMPPPRNAPMPGVSMSGRAGAPPPVDGGPPIPRGPRFTSPTGQQVAPTPNPNQIGGGYLDAQHLPPTPTGQSFNYYNGQGLF